MAFAMSLPRTKRLKHVDANGVESFVDDDHFAFLRQDGLPIQVPSHFDNCAAQRDRAVELPNVVSNHA